MSTQQWWYEQGGQPKGPLGSDEIRTMVESGALVRTSRIIVVGGSEWGTVGDHATELGLPAEPVATAAPSNGGQAPPAGGSATVAFPAAPAYQPAPAPAGALPIVSNGKRFGAWLLDGLLLVVTLFIGWFIWMLCILGKGQTPGKQLLGIRIVDQDTYKVPSYGTVALRVLVFQGLLGSVSSSISTLIGGIMILNDKERRQAFWDDWAKTVVVDDPNKVALQ